MRIKNAKRKIVSMFLALLLCVSCIATPAFAGYLKFNDVEQDDWYARAVNYVAHNELMTGTKGNTFSPNDAMTRAMLVTVLWRMGGSVDPTIENPFIDVADDAWYAKPVLWAYQNGITNGTSANTFSPDSTLTREQMVTFLFKYVDEYKGNNMCHIFPALEKYVDRNHIADYAFTPFSWAVSMGIVRGTSEKTLSPKGATTRAQCAVMLMNLDKLIKDYFSGGEYACAHSEYSLYVWQESTCWAEGMADKICDFCDENLGWEYLPCSPCAALNEQILKSATPSRPGIKLKYCNECGKEEYEEYEFKYPEMIAENSIYIPSAGINCPVKVVDFISNEDTKYNGMVVGQYSSERINETWIVGDSDFEPMCNLSNVKYRDQVFISINGEIKVYEVEISEYALQNDEGTDIVGQKTGVSIFAEANGETLRIYTDKTEQNLNGKWMVLAGLVE